MEVLATNTSFAAAIFLTVIFGGLAIGMLIIANDKSQSSFGRGCATLIGVFAILVTLSVINEPAYVTYDAIVTDWNEVYDNGYKVVETNGDIVTLAKEAD